LLRLFPTILLVYGKVNFTNLSRYSDFSERTYRRQYRQSFGFVEFNQHTIAQAIGATADLIAAIDCSFVPKSGKATYGVDWFYNGSASGSERGLEISLISCDCCDCFSSELSKPALLRHHSCLILSGLLL
jgi:hypothetical protein